MTLRLAAFALCAAMLCATSSHAQNQGQIASVKTGAACAGCNLFQGDFSGLSRNGINLSGARLRQADLSLSTLNRARLNGADLRDVNAYGAVLSNANLSGADLTNSSFVGAWLRGANMTRANLTGANLSGADLSLAVGLTQAQLNVACGDESTRLPSGLRIGAC